MKKRREGNTWPATTADSPHLGGAAVRPEEIIVPKRECWEDTTVQDVVSQKKTKRVTNIKTEGLVQTSRWGTPW